MAASVRGEQKARSEAREERKAVNVSQDRVEDRERHKCRGSQAPELAARIAAAKSDRHDATEDSRERD
jgi:hypothetical protein